MPAMFSYYQSVFDSAKKESVNHLRYYVTQNESLINLTLGAFMVCCGREMTFIVSTVLVIFLSWSEVAVDGVVFVKPAFVSPPTRLCLEHVRSQMLHDPISNSISSVGMEEKKKFKEQFF